MAQRKKPKERKRKAGSRPLILDFQIRRKLEEAEALIDAEDLAGARRVLVELRQRIPGNPAVLEHLAYVYFETQKWHDYLEVAERLRERTPERVELYLSLISGYVQAALPFSAVRTLEDFLARFPRSEHVATAREDLTRIRRLCTDLLADMRKRDGLALVGDAVERFLQRHERMQILMSTGRLDEARELAQGMEQEAPDWPPLCNNLGMILGMLGRNEEALVYAERILTKQPDNAFALAERVRRLYLLGRISDATEAAAQAKLQTRDSLRDDAEVKLAEALALLGDDRGVLDAFASAQERSRPVEPGHRAYLFCLAGTAELRLGNEAAARALWEQAQAQLPAFDPAPQYLEDLERPVEERHIPWYLSAASLFSRDLIDAYIAETRQRKNDDALRARTRLFLDENSALAALLPALLDRGDPHGRTFAFTLCQLAQTPRTLELLRDFALGQHGPDELRYSAMLSAQAAGLLPKDTLTMWLQGAWTEVVSLAFTITREPLRQWPAEFHALITDANRELKLGNAKAAIQLLLPVLRRDRLHISEFIALCGIEIRALIAQREFSGAQRWFEMLRAEAPDDPSFSVLRQLLAAARAAAELDLGASAEPS